MPEPTQRAQRAISALAAKHSLALKDSKLCDREIRIKTNYTGAGHLIASLEGVDITFLQCGANGEWLSIFPRNRCYGFLRSKPSRKSPDD